VRYVKGTADYPSCFAGLPNPPGVVTTSGPLDLSKRVVAIVGSRAAIPEAVAFTEELAFELAKGDFVVISGGAVGVDSAAHRGALRAGGATWCVPPTGKHHVFPKQNRALFAEIEACPRSRMIWAFGDDEDYEPKHPRFRNAILMSLAHDVVVVQAYVKSGSRNAAGWARDLGRRLWVVPAAPWMKKFEGSLDELANGARPLFRLADFFREIGLSATEHEREAKENARPRQRSLFEPDKSRWSEDEKRVFSETSPTPIHVEKLASAAGLSYPQAISSLLTRSLKDVVVEGPDGFFRRSER
jgi:DNA processing protein